MARQFNLRFALGKEQVWREVVEHMVRSSQNNEVQFFHDTLTITQSVQSCPLPCTLLHTSKVTAQLPQSFLPHVTEGVSLPLILSVIC